MTAPDFYTLDLIIAAVAVLLLFAISYVFGRGENDTRDFFLGGSDNFRSVSFYSGGLQI